MKDITNRNSNDARTNPFDSLFQRLTGDTQGLEVEVRERDDEYKVIIDLSEYSDDNVDITIENGSLNVSAELTTENSSEDQYSMSRKTISRQIPVPADADVESTHSNINNGVLVVTMKRQ